MDENTNISDSILSSVKKLIGISEDDDSFDLDIMFNINAASSTLYQLGVLKKPYTITSKEDLYEDLLPGAPDDIIDQVKMYLVYKTRLSFDSSTMTSAVIEVVKKMIDEAEWRLREAASSEDIFERR